MKGIVHVKAHTRRPPRPAKRRPVHEPAERDPSPVVRAILNVIAALVIIVLLYIPVGIYLSI